MIVETTTVLKNPEEGEDVINGWRHLDSFLVGYVRTPRTEHQEYNAVGLFQCTKGDLERTQRHVTNLEIGEALKNETQFFHR